MKNVRKLICALSDEKLLTATEQQNEESRTEEIQNKKQTNSRLLSVIESGEVPALPSLSDIKNGNLSTHN